MIVCLLFVIIVRFRSTGVVYIIKEKHTAPPNVRTRNSVHFTLLKEICRLVSLLVLVVIKV